jgi:hypothetical protein
MQIRIYAIIFTEWCWIPNKSQRLIQDNTFLQLLFASVTYLHIYAYLQLSAEHRLRASLLFLDVFLISLFA